MNKYSTTGVPNSTLGKDLKGLLYIHSDRPPKWASITPFFLIYIFFFIFIIYLLLLRLGMVTFSKLYKRFYARLFVNILGNICINFFSSFLVWPDIKVNRWYLRKWLIYNLFLALLPENVTKCWKKKLLKKLIQIY